MLQNKNKYFNLIARLCAEEKLTVSGFAAKYGIITLPQIMARLKKNPRGGMYLETLSRIERAVGIEITDCGETLDYKRVIAEEAKDEDVELLKEKIKNLHEDLEIVCAMCERLAGQVKKITDKYTGF